MANVAKNIHKLPQSRSELAKSLKPKRHHGWYVVVWLLGLILPPLAVLARFGPGKDFLLNILLTICGYIPGHLHNWYIQNIRDNTRRGRSPQWAVKHGLVDDSKNQQRKKQQAWANRYAERTAGHGDYDDELDPQQQQDSGLGRSRSRSFTASSNYSTPSRARDLERTPTDDSASVHSFYEGSGAVGGLPGAGERDARRGRKNPERFLKKKKSKDRHLAAAEARAQAERSAGRNYVRDDQEEETEVDPTSLAHQF